MATAGPPSKKTGQSASGKTVTSANPATKNGTAAQRTRAKATAAKAGTAKNVKAVEDDAPAAAAKSADLDPKVVAAIVVGVLFIGGIGYAVFNRPSAPKRVPPPTNLRHGSGSMVPGQDPMANGGSGNPGSGSGAPASASAGGAPPAPVAPHSAAGSSGSSGMVGATGGTVTSSGAASAPNTLGSGAPPAGVTPETTTGTAGSAPVLPSPAVPRTQVVVPNSHTGAGGVNGQVTNGRPHTAAGAGGEGATGGATGESGAGTGRTTNEGRISVGAGSVPRPVLEDSQPVPPKP